MLHFFLSVHNCLYLSVRLFLSVLSVCLSVSAYAGLTLSYTCTHTRRHILARVLDRARARTAHRSGCELAGGVERRVGAVVAEPPLEGGVRSEARAVHEELQQLQVSSSGRGGGRRHWAH